MNSRRCFWAGLRSLGALCPRYRPEVDPGLTAENHPDPGEDATPGRGAGRPKDPSTRMHLAPLAAPTRDDEKFGAWQQPVACHHPRWGGPVRAMPVIAHAAKRHHEPDRMVRMSSAARAPVTKILRHAEAAAEASPGEAECPPQRDVPECASRIARESGRVKSPRDRKAQATPGGVSWHEPANSESGPIAPLRMTWLTRGDGVCVNTPG